MVVYLRLSRIRSTPVRRCAVALDYLPMVALGVLMAGLEALRWFVVAQRVLARSARIAWADKNPVDEASGC